MRRLLVVFGTRPEVIKLAPVILEARRRASEFEVVTLATGQHREMLEQALSSFGITPQANLDLMKHKQDLTGPTADALAGTASVIGKLKPDWVVVQGDTVTAFAAALAAFFSQVGVAHVEAGLRTRNLRSPFPEEANRQLIGRLASLHLAPTDRARRNLLEEGVPASAILVTGNTVVDAIHAMQERWKSASECPLPGPLAGIGEGIVLITCHRREHFGDGMRAICAALGRLAASHPELAFVFPVHLNPNVRGPVHAALGRVTNLRLVEPVDYRTSLRLLERSRLVLTDSGGIQEEAPSFGVPVVVMREYTERAEGVEQGFATLAGPDADVIVRQAERFLAERGVRERLLGRPNPYGDGHAARRVLDALAAR